MQKQGRTEQLIIQPSCTSPAFCEPKQKPFILLFIQGPEDKIRRNGSCHQSYALNHLNPGTCHTDNKCDCNRKNGGNWISRHFKRPRHIRLFFLNTRSDKQTIHSRILPANTLMPSKVPKEPVQTNINAVRQINNVGI